MFSAPARKPGSRGPAPSALIADRDPRQLTQLAASLAEGDFQTLVYTTREGEQVSSRFAMLR